jgi:CrcB protein
VLYLAVALGGAVGALLRWSLGEAVPDGSGFPWTTFAVNVSGSALLALLPASSAVRRRPTLTVGLGPGLLGGYTTLSAYAEQTRELLDRGHPLTAAGYLVGTVSACLLAVALVSRTYPRATGDEFAARGGDE